jgi:hypothetical protein
MFLWHNLANFPAFFWNYWGDTEEEFVMVEVWITYLQTISETCYIMDTHTLSGNCDEITFHSK